MTETADADLLAMAQAFVDRKYVARADERQKSMGLAYVEAERQDLAREIVRFVRSLPGEPQPTRERTWTGPGHLEHTGYIDKQERCPTCERTDRQYKLGRERGHHGLCRDAWHADDHLRASSMTRPQSGITPSGADASAPDRSRNG